MLSFTEPAVMPAEADAYADARAWSDWTGTDTVKAAAIRRSQDYIAAIYNHCWADEWSNDEAPENVRFAIIEGARRELVSPGSLDPDVTPGKIKERVRVEGAVEVAYAIGKGDAASQRPVIGIIDNLLAPLLKGAGFGATVDILRV